MHQLISIHLLDSLYYTNSNVQVDGWKLGKGCFLKEDSEVLYIPRRSENLQRWAAFRHVKVNLGLAQWHTPVTLALKMVRPEVHKFPATVWPRPVWDCVSRNVPSPLSQSTCCCGRDHLWWCVPLSLTERAHPNEAVLTSWVASVTWAWKNGLPPSFFVTCNMGAFG